MKLELVKNKNGALDMYFQGTYLGMCPNKTHAKYVERAAIALYEAAYPAHPTHPTNRQKEVKTQYPGIYRDSAGTYIVRSPRYLGRFASITQAEAAKSAYKAASKEERLAIASSLRRYKKGKKDA